MYPAAAPLKSQSSPNQSLGWDVFAKRVEIVTKLIEGHQGHLFGGLQQVPARVWLNQDWFLE